MSLPLIRLAIGRTIGTAHYGVLLDAIQPLTVCVTHQAVHECGACRCIWQEAEVARQTYMLPQARERARWWHQRQERDLDVFDERAGALQSGDAYSLSGCAETHDVVAAADRIRESHRDLVVYLLTDDRLADVRVHRDRVVAFQRPSHVTDVMLQPTALVP